MRGIGLTCGRQEGRNLLFVRASSKGTIASASQERSLKRLSLRFSSNPRLASCACHAAQRSAVHAATESKWPLKAPSTPGATRFRTIGGRTCQRWSVRRIILLKKHDLPGGIGDSIHSTFNEALENNCIPARMAHGETVA